MNNKNAEKNEKLSYVEPFLEVLIIDSAEKVITSSTPYSGDGDEDW
mgnify:CR=1 FL=1